MMSVGVPARMDFRAVVQRARELHAEGKVPSGEESAAELAEEVYGRICNTVSAGPPKKLATSAGRKVVFIFGPDAISSIVLRKNTYDALLRLGSDRAHIYHEVVEKKATYWLVLFKPTACKSGDEFIITPATWDGVVQIVETCYPEAYADLDQHLPELRTKNFEQFETEAGFEFLEAKKNEDGSIPNGQPYYSYQYYCTLPKPRAAWQVRLLLYCELRLLKLFKGSGVTLSEDGKRGSLEYFCSNIPLSALDPKESVAIPMTVTIPD